MSAIDVNAYDHIMRNQEKSKPRHIHVVQNFLLFQPMAGSIFAIEYWVSSKSWWHNFQRLFWEATSGLYGCFCPSWTISGYRWPFGLCKTFFGDTLFTASKYVYEQTAIAYEVCCLLWCRLVAVEIDGHQQWTNDWHTSLRMCLLHTGGGDTTRFNHLESQSFGVSIICLSKMKNKLRR